MNSKESKTNLLRFSDRLDFYLDKNPQTKLQESLERRGITLFDLTNSNPLQCGFDYPNERISSALARSPIRYQPDPLGIEKARKAVCDYYLTRGIAVSPDFILLTASTSEAYSYLFKLLANPDENLMIPQPSYPLFDYLASFEKVLSVPYPLFYNDLWYTNVEVIKEKITDDTKALLLVNPNNPTGNFIRETEWKKIIELCNERNLTLICDEVFFDYPMDTVSKRFDPAKNSNLSRGCFFLNGLSKTAGLPQLKLSWILANGPEEFVNSAFQRLELIADTYLSVNTPVQEALPEIFDHAPKIRKQILDRVNCNYRWVQEALKDSAVSALSVQGGWSVVLKLPAVKSEEEWVIDMLETGNVVVHPGEFFGFSTGPLVVVSLLVRTEDFEEGIKRVIGLVGSG